MKFNSIINDVCCDSRIKDGVLRLEMPEHVFVLQEYLEKAGFSIDAVVERTAKLFEAGRFPERQAYNKDGILVTFPSKEYRDRAVDKGTHFAENPKKNAGTLFSPSDTGGLSTADIAKTDSGEEDKQDKSDTVSLDKELNKKVTGDDKKDDRSTKEKVQDAAAVDSILTGGVPLINQQVDECEDCGCNDCEKEEYTVNEATELGYVKNGLRWYDKAGNMIGEQVYKENVGPVVVVEKQVKCNAQKMEYHINDEFAGIETDDDVAKKIVAKLKKQGIKASTALGNLRCNITNPIFANIDRTSKTDLIFEGKTRMRASLKAKGAQICSAQNAEVNSVVSAILKDSGEDVKVMEQVSSFIMDGLQKKFYIGLNDEVKEKLQKSLTNAVKGNKSVDQIKAEVGDIEKIIIQNKQFVKKGVIPVNTETVMLTLNSVFVQPARRRLLIEELATGKRRFQQGKADFSAECIADYMMTWDCSGDCHYYTVDKFITENDKNISFRFSNRGGTRGIAIRGDIKLEEIKLDEGLMDTVQSIGKSISDYFSDVWTTIKSLSGELKDFFTKAWENIKSGLQSIFEVLLRFSRYLNALISEGWESFTEFLGFEGHADGAWRWEMPNTSTQLPPVAEPTLT
jgi:hypothetical protein